MVKKGFIHIAEVVMISILLVVSLAFILRPVDVEESWDTVELGRLGESALDSVRRKHDLGELAVNSSDKLENEMDEMLYSTGEGEALGYSIRADNSYRSEITLGFNCTGSGCIGNSPSQEERALKGLLGGMKMNNRRFNIWNNTESVNWTRFRDKEYRDRFDLLFLRGEDQARKANRSLGAVRSYMEEGGGIVQLSDFGDVENLEIQNEIFGLEESGTGSDEASFTEREDVTKPSYGPSKLFYGAASMANDTWKLRGEEYRIEVEEPGEEINVMNSTGNGYLCKGCIEGDEFELEDDDLAEDSFTVREIREVGDSHPYGGTVAWFNYPENYSFRTDGFSSSANSTSGEEFEVVGDEAPRMVVNKPLNGRAVWISTDADNEAGEGVKDDIQSLVRGGVVWAAPRGEKVKEGARPRRSSASEIIRFGVLNKDIYEPYKITMKIWYRY